MCKSSGKENFGDRSDPGKGRALFLDRDGVVNKDLSYISKPEEIVFCKGIFRLCQEACALGYIIVIITNQSGIARGYFTERDLEKLHDWIRERFFEKGIGISGIYYCPHHIDGSVSDYAVDCTCRKPRPGMILKAALDLDISIKKSIMIGDKESDRIDLKQLRSFIVKSRYTKDNYDLESLEEAIPLL